MIDRERKSKVRWIKKVTWTGKRTPINNRDEGVPTQSRMGRPACHGNW